MATNRPKVLHLITRLAMGGAQDNTLLTVEKHDRSRFAIHLASNCNGYWSSRAEAVAEVLHPLPHLINPIHPIKDIKALSDIVRLLDREKFDIVHTHSSKAGILGRWAARIAKAPVVVHTIHSFSFHDFMPAWQRQLYINLERSASFCTDFFITVSELNRQEAAKLRIVSLKNSQTVYSGIDFDKLDQPANLPQIRQQLDIPSGWQVVVMIGRLDPQKAPQLLLEAFAQVLKHHSETLLLFVGEGELQPALKIQAQQLRISDRTRFLGSRMDVPDILKVADIFALSSLWEGLGRAMTEAMLLGKPVVVPDIYGIPEIVHPDQTGLLFPVGDVDQLATHLCYLLQHPEERQRLGENAKQLTRQLFDADHMVQQIEQIYNRLLSSKTTVSSA